MCYLISVYSQKQSSVFWRCKIIIRFSLMHNIRGTCIWSFIKLCTHCLNYKLSQCNFNLWSFNKICCLSEVTCINSYFKYLCTLNFIQISLQQMLLYFYFFRFEFKRTRYSFIHISSWFLKISQQIEMERFVFYTRIPKN